MNITCSGCGKKYRIDDSKIPPSGKVVMKCPGCGNRMEITAPDNTESIDTAQDMTADTGSFASQGTDGMETGKQDSHGPSETAGSASSGSGASQASPPEDDDSGLEFFEPGTKTALVFCPDYEAMKQLQEKLKEKEYEVRQVSSAGEVQARFRYHVYDLIVLYQSGPEPEDRLQEILNWINNMGMDVRRQILVIHISINGNRFDTMQAFSLGVDTCLSPLDIANFPDILDKVNNEREARYMVFNECLARVRDEVT